MPKNFCYARKVLGMILSYHSGAPAVQGHASHVVQLAQGSAVLHILHGVIMLAALAII